MSKGNRMVGLRLPPDVSEALDREIAAINATRADEPYTVASFILSAVRLRLRRLEEDRRRRRKGGSRS